jgi:thioredoxin 1
MSAAVWGADIELISQGRSVDLEGHLVPGKLVLFDFYADWCAPCRYLEPQIDRLAEQFPERLAVRKVDVIDWNSPVARQHRIGSLPYLVLYGPDGNRLADGDVERVFGVLRTELGGIDEAGRGGRRLAIPTTVWVAAFAALVFGSLVVGRRAGAARARNDRQAVAEATGPRDRDDPGRAAPIWFVMIGGSLEGPFSVEQLTDLRRRKTLDADDRVRRRGDAAWRRLADVIGPR